MISNKEEEIDIRNDIIIEIGNEALKRTFSQQTFTIQNITESKSNFENKKKSKSCFNFIESTIPLSLKLFFLIIFALISLIGFGIVILLKSYQMLDNARHISFVGNLFVIFSDLSHNLQYERGLSALYLGRNESLGLNELYQQRNRTDVLIQQYRKDLSSVEMRDSYLRAFMSNERNSNQVIENIKLINNYYIAKLDTHRKEGFYSFFDFFQFYTDWIRTISDCVILLSSQSNDARISSFLTSYTSLIQTKELLALKRGVGAIILESKGFTAVTYNYYISLVSKYDEERRIFELRMSQQIYDFYKQLMFTNVSENIDRMEKYMLDNYSNLILYTSEVWFNNVTIQINNLRIVEKELRTNILDTSSDITRRAIASLSGFFIAILLVMTISISLALVFSKTIVNPWRKLLALQEDMVHKFVPKEFMNIIQKEKVTELEHGDYYEMELDVMFADIRKYTTLSEQMSVKETFKFINTYLSAVGPIVRKYDGYIDKYMGDGIICLFLTPGKSVEAAMALQKEITKFNNNTKYPDISVGIGIARGRVAVGLVGESKRMDATIIGDTVNLASRVESLTKHFGAGILVTKQVIDSSLIEINKNIYRKIGNVAVVGKKCDVELIEIFPEYSTKYVTREIFEKGVSNLFDINHLNVENALIYFNKVLEMDKDDTSAKLRKELCEDLLRFEQDLGKWNCVELLKTK
ncbi:hypothetical protein ABK040_006932 [Willaertia magna]